MEDGVQSYVLGGQRGGRGVQRCMELAEQIGRWKVMGACQKVMGGW